MRTSATVQSADGVPLHVWEGGVPDGPPLLALHGIGQSGLAFSALEDTALAQRHRLVCPDLRGHGRSGSPTDGAGLQESQTWAGDVQAVVDALGLDAPVLLGWSYGGVVALDHLAAGGDVVALVLVGAPPGAGVPDAAAWFDPGFVELAPGLMATDVPGRVEAHRALVRRCTAEPLDPLAAAALLGEAVLTPAATVAGVLGRSVDHRPVLASSDVPVLLVAGERDEIITSAAADAVAASRSEVQVVRLDCGHSPFVERPEDFTAAVLGFLDDASTTGNGSA